MGNDSVDARLPVAEFAFPGPLRDRLVDAILRGDKVSTTSLAAQYDLGEPMPEPGQRFAVVDSVGRRVAVIEVTDVAIVSLGAVDLAHCVDEGEGYTSVEAWREAHEAFWRGEEVRAEFGERAGVLDDATPVVLERFKLVARLGGPDR
ncbi:MAG: ASCH domain-containing protein [Acidimicrobiales bacterium]